jgi:spore cortex formation protein SpoVR/YcgB (stage V sporulation)
VGKFTHFRHSVNARNDDKIKELGRLLGRKSKEAYFHYFALIELCSSESDEGQTEFKIHNNTLRTLWESNAKGVQTMCELLAKSALVVCKPCVNHVVFEIPNLPNYLGSYETNKIKKIKEKKENKLTEDPKKILPPEASQDNLKKPSPLSVYFSDSPEIQEWLDAGVHETHLMLLKKYSHHEVVDLIARAYAWAKPRGARAETWLYTFVSNTTTPAYGANRHQKKSRATPANPTGNPYLNDDGSLKEQA